MNRFGGGLDIKWRGLCNQLGKLKGQKRELSRMGSGSQCFHGNDTY